MRKLVLTVLIGTLASAAGASTWISVAQEEQGSVLLDADSVQRSGSIVKVWVELKKSDPQANGIGYEVDHWSVDCSQMTLASLATVQFRPDGTRIGSDSAYYPERVAIPPKSIGFDVYRLVCR
jgi:hypothetical protein